LKHSEGEEEMAREVLERAALTSALNTYLDGRGWTDVTFKEGFDIETTIDPPLVAVHFLPTNAETLQIGNVEDKLFRRVVQFDAYMENELRASAIQDDIMDFADLIPVIITDPLQNALVVGSLICQDNDSIYGENFAPILTDVKVKRWRSIVRATYEAHYP
jgi:hypothetical protein